MIRPCLAPNRNVLKPKEMGLSKPPLFESEPTPSFRSDGMQHPQPRPPCVHSLQPYVEHAPDFHACRVEKLQCSANQNRTGGGLFEYLSRRIKQQRNLVAARTLESADYSLDHTLAGGLGSPALSRLWQLLALSCRLPWPVDRVSRSAHPSSLASLVTV